MEDIICILTELLHETVSMAGQGAVMEAAQGVENGGLGGQPVRPREPPF